MGLEGWRGVCVAGSWGKGGFTKDPARERMARGGSHIVKSSTPLTSQGLDAVRSPGGFRAGVSESQEEPVGIG